MDGLLYQNRIMFSWINHHYSSTPPPHVSRVQPLSIQKPPPHLTTTTLLHRTRISTDIFVLTCMPTIDRERSLFVFQLLTSIEQVRVSEFFSSVQKHQLVLLSVLKWEVWTGKENGWIWVNPKYLKKQVQWRISFPLDW